MTPMGSWVAVNSWDKERGGGKKTDWFLVFTLCKDFFFWSVGNLGKDVKSPVSSVYL